MQPLHSCTRRIGLFLGGSEGGGERWRPACVIVRFTPICLPPADSP